MFADRSFRAIYSAVSRPPPKPAKDALPANLGRFSIAGEQELLAGLSPSRNAT